jgi:hypothetical protein
MKNLKTILAIAIIVILSSCNPEEEVVTNTEVPGLLYTFVAGHESKEVSTTTNGSNERTRAMYWYKGNEVLLGNSNNSSKALGVFGVLNTSGTGEKFDVYTVGFEEENGIKKARLWKNKIQQPLDIEQNLLSVATSIFVVNDTDVYIAGHETSANSQQTRAVFWKNGVKNYLTEELGDSYAKAITVDNGTVYVAGIHELQSKAKAVYWKNYQMVYLPVMGEGSNSELPTSQCANAIAVKNDKVYCAGYALFDDVTGGFNGLKNAVYWKNNLAIKITNYNSEVNGIAVDDLATTGYDNVYCAGYEKSSGNPRAAIWKNVDPQLGFEPSSANSTVNAIVKTDKYFLKAGFSDGIQATSWSTNDTRNVMRIGGNVTYANCINATIR